MAVHPVAHRPQAACTPATSLRRAAAALLLLFLYRYPARRCSRQPAVCPRPYPHGLSPLRLLLPRALAVSPRSLPTQSDTLGSSPENHSALKILSSHL